MPLFYNYKIFQEIFAYFVNVSVKSVLVLLENTTLAYALCSLLYRKSDF